MQLHRGFVCFRLPRLADLDILQVSLALYSLLTEVILGDRQIRPRTIFLWQIGLV